MTEIHPDRNSFEKIWKEVIYTEIQNYQKKYPECLSVIPEVKEEIWNSYVFYNSYCKTNYMKYKDMLLDRHKVAACYMAAVAMVRPVKVIKEFESIKLAINELLAITVGLSVMRAYVQSAILQDDGLNDSEKKVLLDKFENGIVIPGGNLVSHGSYLENYSNELFHAVYEGNLNILSLANELYLLEVITRVSPLKSEACSGEKQ